MDGQTDIKRWKDRMTARHTYRHTYIHTARHTDIHTDRHRDRHTYSQTSIHTYIQTYMQTDRQMANSEMAGWIDVYAANSLLSRPIVQCSSGDEIEQTQRPPSKPFTTAEQL